MYDEHYGLSGRPFQLTPDPKFWFETATHRKAMAYLGYGLSQGEGFIVITGDPGAGKTTLVGHLMDQIDRERLHVIKIVSTQIDAAELLHLVAAGLNVDTARLSKAHVLASIERALHAIARSGKRTLLVIDEAQSLPVGSLEELRMLSNFQTGGYPLLQIFLLGQPEFRDVLQSAGSLEQLRQRVIAMHHLEPMEAEEVEPYLIHRLQVVGWEGRPDFDADAITALHRWSGGVPRLLNQLAGRVMLYGAIEGIDRFTADDVATVTTDIDCDMADRPGRPGAAPRPIRADIVPPPPTPPPAPTRDGALEARIAELEQRLEEQDAALRRVLTLLVEWVEGDGGRPEQTVLRGTAA
ncbi:ExeA family protein [Sphingomonas qomolangmaensis]|uniref:AAA family ATPase n=1 Tax=Sphingomonas qomolangmaensis TaxID=2918765 RepID=A0ABY5LEU8_9SPHN|nr:AAA family ATPase [Sphingomonas qomolangmaensis]UUL83236.1 AAA family ATPase [Sphingomonas qomolangmaensis]